MTGQQYARLFLLSLVILTAGFVGRSLLMGGVTSVVRLKPGPPLAGAISQSLAKYGKDGGLPVINKDYSIQNTVTFEEGEWTVVTIKASNSESGPNSSLIVLQKEDGLYKTILGPGTAFPDTYLQILPANVGGYLYNQGAIYGISD